ncbi:MAG: benzoyl-CoA reductase subunit C [Planctomycetes bacterium]|nr:benzoyl-CoA reductase subunit C [Planctomycetota bacterium]
MSSPATAVLDADAKAILARCEELYEDLELSAVKAWKAAHPGALAIGYLPTYVPREILHAAGCLPVGVLGAGEQLEIVKGDACFQSYICHFPRSVIELGLSGRLDALDGMIFPSTCDVIRNLSGIWKLSFPGKFARYLDVPQNFDPRIGGRFYRRLLDELHRDLCRLSGREPSAETLWASIAAYDENRRAVRELYELRREEPWRVRASEAYLVLRAGMQLDVHEHTELVRSFLQAVRGRPARAVDDARVVLCGAFCEQPPLGLIRTLERAGCEVVDDDYMLVLRWLGELPRRDGDPLDALSDAYLAYSGETASRYVPDGTAKGERLVQAVRKSRAEGVIFAAPSFCDPALLDRPMLQAVCDREGIAHTALKYAENTGQMQPIREQAGTFADAIKLWGDV